MKSSLIVGRCISRYSSANGGLISQLQYD